MSSEYLLKLQTKIYLEDLNTLDSTERFCQLISTNPTKLKHSSATALTSSIARKKRHHLDCFRLMKMYLMAD